jgi:hypothetical protein
MKQNPHHHQFIKQLSNFHHHRSINTINQFIFSIIYVTHRDNPPYIFLNKKK